MEWRAVYTLVSIFGRQAGSESTPYQIEWLDVMWIKAPLIFCLSRTFCLQFLNRIVCHIVDLDVKALTGETVLRITPNPVCVHSNTSTCRCHHIQIYPSQINCSEYERLILFRQQCLELSHNLISHWAIPTNDNTSTISHLITIEYIYPDQRHLHLLWEITGRDFLAGTHFCEKR